MSTLFSDPLPVAKPAQILSFPYPEIGLPIVPVAETVKGEGAAGQESIPSGPGPAEIEAMIERTRAEAVSQTEKRMNADFEQKARRYAQQINAAIEQFAQERSKYFAQVEAEVVRLSLAIARRILHREAQVDPLVVAGLVRVAIERIETMSEISVRVAPQNCQKWREHLADLSERVNLSFVADPHLGDGDCVLETQMGSTELGIEAQVAEVEKGFFDLLAQRPSQP